MWQTVSVRMVDEEEEAMLREEEARKEIEDAKQTTGNGSHSKVLNYVVDVIIQSHQTALPSLSIAFKFRFFY